MEVGEGTDTRKPRNNPVTRKMSEKRKKIFNYRSENFSTTRTLSPRTVIGIGTMLS
jgi:hypothetical protein